MNSKLVLLALAINLGAGMVAHADGIQQRRQPPRQQDYDDRYRGEIDRDYRRTPPGYDEDDCGPRCEQPQPRVLCVQAPCNNNDFPPEVLPMPGGPVYGRPGYPGPGYPGPGYGPQCQVQIVPQGTWLIVPHMPQANVLVPRRQTPQYNVLTVKAWLQQQGLCATFNM